VVFDVKVLNKCVLGVKYIPSVFEKTLDFKEGVDLTLISVVEEL